MSGGKTKILGAKKHAKQLIENNDWPTVMRLLIDNRARIKERASITSAYKNIEFRYNHIKTHERLWNFIKSEICRRYGTEVYMNIVAAAAKQNTDVTIAELEKEAKG